MTHTYNERFATTTVHVDAEIKAHWYRYVIAGTLVAALGLVSALFPFAASIAGNYAFGSVLALAGIVQVAHGMQAQGWKCTGLNLLSGMLALIAGTLLLIYPLTGLITLTTVVAFFLIGTGVFKLAYAARLRPEDGWRSLTMAGTLAILLALLVLSQWPQASVWLLGLLIGFDLLFGGVWLIGLGLNARKAPDSEAA